MHDSLFERQTFTLCRFQGPVFTSTTLHLTSTQVAVDFSLNMNNKHFLVSSCRHPQPGCVALKRQTCSPDRRRSYHGAGFRAWGVLLVRRGRVAWRFGASSMNYSSRLQQSHFCVWSEPINRPRFYVSMLFNKAQPWILFCVSIFNAQKTTSVLWTIALLSAIMNSHDRLWGKRSHY